MGKFSDALQFWTKPLTRGGRAITGNLDENEQDQLRKEQENLYQSILRTTQPYRMGANVFVQNYAPAIRALAGGDPLERGRLEEWTAGALTPEEQDYLERKPYMAALKSSAGMTSSLMPFTSRAVPAATLGARTAQIAGRGLLEGVLGGFGYSREGKELQDTAIGGGIGMGGELLGNYVFDPSYRDLVNQGVVNMNTGKYQAAVNPGVNIDTLRTRAYDAAGLNPDDSSLMGQGMGISHKNKYITDIEYLQRGNKSPEVGEYLLELREQGLVDPGQVDMLLKLDYGIQPQGIMSDKVFEEGGLDPIEGNYGTKLKEKNLDSYIKILTGEEGDKSQIYNISVETSKKDPGRLAEKPKGEWIERGGVKTRNTSANDFRDEFKQVTDKILDDKGNLKPDLDSKLLQEAKKYKNPDEFLKAKKPLYHRTDVKFDKFNTSLDPDEMGTWFAKGKDMLTEDARDFPILMERIPSKKLRLITEKAFSGLENTNEYLDSPMMPGPYLENLGYDGIDYGHSVLLFNPNEATLTKSQLTDIWNKAWGG